MQAHDKAEDLVAGLGRGDRNEATTRHQIIDVLMHEVLGWPRTRVTCEELISPGFADYILHKSEKTPVLLIEAKREGSYFTVPTALTDGQLATYVKVKTLLTDDSISKAVNQARNYCLNIGCEFAAITNGHEWVLFRTFKTGADWRDLRAFVITGLAFFADKFTEAHNALSYVAIVDSGSLRKLLLDTGVANRELFYPQKRITPFDAAVDANGYASSLRPIADRYFGVIDVADAEFMDKCYVSDREYDVAFSNARRRLEDAITPFLEQYDIRHFRDADSGGGAFGSRLSKHITGARAADVVVLFGGKGVGKSTFLRRLLFHKAPQILKKHAAVALIDLVNVPPDAPLIRNTIWTGLIKSLDAHNVLAGKRDELCVLFADRFEQAQKQELFGLDVTSEAYNIRLNGLVGSWKEDYPYVAAKLAARIRHSHKGVIVVLDNTDQYEGEEQLQELCFAIGREIASTFPCLVVLSMREERFYASTVRGMLDAYQNSGFHITAPAPKAVFLKRFEYVLQLLSLNEDARKAYFPDRIDTTVLSHFFRILQNNFTDKSSHLANFLSACSRGNIRLALELFRGFVVSGYTNVYEMTSNERWTLQIHQVLKPFMIPSRFFYSEAHSRVPNLFQIRSKTHGSHFTALRILSQVHRGHDERAAVFVPVAQLAMYFAEQFAMREDFDLNMDMLLKYGLIEANNRLDAFSEAVDSVKVTPYGSYMLDALSQSFTYIELTCVDCAVSELATSNEIAELSKDEYRIYTKKQRMQRVEVRLSKADAFIGYLNREEKRERELFRAVEDRLFTQSMRDAFDKEKVRVLKSAHKNVDRYAH